MPAVQQAIRCNRAPRRVAFERFRKAPAANTRPCATRWGVIVPSRGSSQCRGLDSDFSHFHGSIVSRRLINNLYRGMTRLDTDSCCDLFKSAAAPGASPMVLLAIARMK